MIRIILRLIIELAIAVGIFFCIVKYTSLFDQDLFNYDPPKTTLKQIVPELEDTRDLASNSGLHGLNIEDTYPLHGGASLFSDEILARVEKNLGLTVEEKETDLRPCVVPRSKSEVIPHGQSLVAYASPIANSSNICNGNLRFCDNGTLEGSNAYKYQNCSYTIDGVNNGKEVIPGASEHRHQLFTYIKGQDDPQEFIQPERKPAKDTTAIFDLDGKRIAKETNIGNTERDNSINTTENYDINDLVQFTDVTHLSCVSPRGSPVQHGDYIIARNNKVADPGEDCLLEKRPCIDGRLFGTYKQRKCYNKPMTITSSKTQLEEPTEPESAIIPRGNPIKDEELDIRRRSTRIKDWIHQTDDCCTLQDVEEKPVDLTTGDDSNKTCPTEIITIDKMIHGGVCNNIGCTGLIPGILVYISTDQDRSITVDATFTNTLTNKKAYFHNQSASFKSPHDTLSISYPSILLDKSNEALIHDYITTEVTISYETSCKSKTQKASLSPKKKDPYCGDGICQSNESSSSCSADCGAPKPEPKPEPEPRPETCAKEGERGKTGPIYPDYHIECCAGLKRQVTSPPARAGEVGHITEFLCYDPSKGSPYCKNEMGRYYPDRSLLARDRDCQDSARTYCGDGICQLNKNENTIQCPSDCNAPEPDPECTRNTDCPTQQYCKSNSCVPVGCVGDGDYTPGTISPEFRDHMPNTCCTGLKTLRRHKEVLGCAEVPYGGGQLCTSKCGNGVCDQNESKCTCPEDCISTSGPECGNGICEPGEKRQGCTQDCRISGRDPNTGRCEKDADCRTQQRCENNRCIANTDLVDRPDTPRN